MGFFTKDVIPAPGGIVPLSKERIKAALKAQGWSYSVDADGDICGGWDYATFYFFVFGGSDEVFSVRGFWRGRLDQSEYQKALDACNQWNQEKLWPKTYVAHDDEGLVRINAEHSVDYEHGLTDDMLAQHLMCAINTGMAFFEHICEIFPEEWAKYSSED